ncbi:MAG: hypothetical protein ACYCQL_00035 [Acidithiobacillus sp.]
MPAAKTLAVLYEANHDRLRSVYQSPAVFGDEARNYPEKTPETFYHVSGEKLVNLVMEVACDVSAYGQNNVLVPQLATHEEVRGMAYSRAQSVSNWDDSFEFREDWSTAEGLRVNRVVEVVREPGKNRAKNIAIDIPVEFAPSKSGVDIFEMLKAAERGTIIPPEVFMYAAARKTQEAGEDFAPEFVENLKKKAVEASDQAAYHFRWEKTILQNDMAVVRNDSDEVDRYKAGSVFRGFPVAEHRVFQLKDEDSKDRFYLARFDFEDVKIKGPDGTIGITRKPVVYAMVYDTNKNQGLVDDSVCFERDDFHENFVELNKDDAQAALVKYFGYSAGEDSLSMPNEAAALDDAHAGCNPAERRDLAKY